MKLNKRQTFFAVLAAWLFLCLLYQSIWIFSGTTTAEIEEVGKTKIFRNRPSLSWMEGSYTVDYRTYYGLYLRDEYDIRNRTFKIRYLLFAPGLSRANNFVSNWGPLIMFFVLMSLVTGILFIRKDILSDKAIVVIQGRRPFVSITNNQIEDYDEHGIVSEKTDKAQQLLREKLENERNSASAEGVSASVYKFNPNAIAIFVVYVFFFFWYFYSLLRGSLEYPGIIFWGAVLLFVPLYVQNTNNPVFKTQIPDQGSLLFSDQGIQFKEEFYPLEDIRAAAVYLEAFQGFAYRDRTSLGNGKTISSGDNNKISFSCQKGVTDFTFILTQASDYWALKHLMAGWSAKGVAVVLQKVFEDDFIIQEMVHFYAPA